MINLNELRDKAYKCACDHGFHDKELSNEHYLMLVIIELSEAVEADRKNKHADRRGFESDNAFQSDHMPEAFIDNFETFIKDTVEDELSDAAIRLLDLCGSKHRHLDEDPFNEETIQQYSETYKNWSFTESVYYIVNLLSGGGKSIMGSSAMVEILLLEILGFAKHLDIELDWYIEQKMKYNELRPYKNEKNY